MTALRELPPLRTPINYPAVINSLLLTWEVTGLSPTKAACRLAAAQIAIESGLSSCWNYNLSGIKSHPNNGKTCWQYFATHELFTEAQVAYAEKVGPGLIQRVGPKGGKIDIIVHPKHPFCCFRAFESLNDAMSDHLLTLQSRFHLGWEALLTGDPEAFAHGLRQGGYYTALETEYHAGLDWRIAQEIKSVPDDDLVWGDVA